MIKAVLIVVIGLTLALNSTRRENDYDIFGFRKEAELPAAPSAQIFLCHSCTGRQAFLQPMLRRAFIDSMAKVERSFAIPKNFQGFSHSPGKIFVEKSQSNISVVLEGFVYRPQTIKNSSSR